MIDHGEVHLLDTAGDLHHLDPVDGSSIFVGRHGSALTTWAAGSGLVLRQGGDGVAAFSLLERQVWEVSTGTRPPDRISVVRVEAGYAATLTFDTSPR